MFCEIFNIELNIFIVNTVKSYLYEIGDDFGERNYGTIGNYYDISKLVSEQPHKISHKNPEENIKVEAEFPCSISTVIEYICVNIPLTFKEFIVDIVNGEIDVLIYKIKMGEYDFLGKYKDFSKIEKLIQQIREGDPL